MIRHSIALSIALCIAALAGRARGEPVSPDRAVELKQEGDSAMVSLRYADALDAYSASYELDRNPALLYNLGRALQALGRYPEAFAKLEAFSTAAPPELKRKVPKLAELIEDVRIRVSRLMVTSNVAGARVHVRKRELGPTPLVGPISLNAGNAVIEVSAEGYLPYRRIVRLPPGGEYALHVELLERDRSGILLVATNVRGARVFVDGKLVGMAPTETIVSPGTHRVSATHAGYHDAQSTAVLRAGERKSFVVELEATVPITQRWWFWTGVGAVVAGGAALSIALLSERSPDNGDIPPGQIAATLLRY